MSIQSEVERLSQNVQNTLEAIRQTGVSVPENATCDDLPAAAAALANEKQDKLTGSQGQVVGFDSQGNAQAQDPPGGGSGKRVCRFVVGTSTAGWTADDCDYLCDGTADDVEINAAIQALPSTGGEIVILDGTYNITATIAMNKDNVTLSGNGAATVLKRMWDSTSADGIITITAANGSCCVENLSIDGNKDVYSEVLIKSIYINESSYNIIKNITISNGYTYAVYLKKSNNNVIHENFCYNQNYGIYLDTSSKNNSIISNKLSEIKVYAISIWSVAENNSIIGNFCYNAGGIFINGYYSSVSGNTCVGNTRGIDLSSNYCTVTGNIAYNNDVGIFVSGFSKGNTICGNTCIRNTGSSEDYSSTQYTIQASVGTSKNLISGNNIMGKNYVDSGTNNTWANNKYQ